jgi:hypothetical protein
MATDKVPQAQSSQLRSTGCFLIFVLGMLGVACGFLMAWYLNQDRHRSEKLDFMNEIALFGSWIFGSGVIGASVGAVISLCCSRPSQERNDRTQTSLVPGDTQPGEHPTGR